MMTNNELRHLQECELIIAREIKRICEKHDLKYYIVCGTLLGSIRHEGFIPWDDDIDIGMERKEYDRFCKICADELNDAFVLQTWDVDGDFPFSYGKMRLKGTYIEESFSSGKNSKYNGIFVDIFPFDNVPENKIKKQKQSAGYYFLKRILWLKKGYGASIKNEGKIKCFKYLLSSAILKALPYQLVKKKYNKFIRKYNDECTQELVMDSKYSYEKNIIKRKWLEDTNMYKFEGTEFMSFRDYDAYLSHLYMNYMKLPPSNQRHNHDIIKIDFGKY